MRVPGGAQDIDDALHVRELPDGTLEVGVHIADVSHFVKAGTAIDAEAADRGNTTYLVDRRLDMLPGLLTEHLCSLKGGIERFAFSAVWIMTREGATLDEKFGKTLIRSRAALTYAEAQARMDDAAQTNEIAVSIRLLNSIAKILRGRRIAAGALTLASPEVRFLLDSETHDPLSVEAYALRETNALVEEFMLLANTAVAARITRAYPRCAMLRRHPAPSKRSFDQLVAAAETVGIKLDVSSSKVRGMRCAGARSAAAALTARPPLRRGRRSQTRSTARCCPTGPSSIACCAS